MPGKRLWDACTSEQIAARPPSLKIVIDPLRADVTRRYWIGAATLTSASAIYYAARSAKAQPVSLPVGARVLLNGFRSAMEDTASARLARSLLLTALRESARLRAIADLDLIPTLRRINPEGERASRRPSLARIAIPLTGRVLDRR